MKKILSLLAFALITNFAYGQIEKTTYEKISDNFVENYNSDNFGAIFQCFRQK